MGVLVLGGYGLIGSAIVERLAAEGVAVIGLGRDVAAARCRWPHVEWREADLRELTRAKDWAPLLAGVEVVVNAAGVLQDGLGDSLADVHEHAMAALYEAAVPARLARIVQISAAGAAPDAAVEFLRGKGRADAALAASGRPFVILRPGLAISPAAYGGTALLRALAAVPLVTPLAFAASPVQTVWIGDVADAVAAAVKGEIRSGTVLDLVEPEPRTLAETASAFRAWLGLPPARALPLPAGLAGAVAAVADGLGRLGWRSPLRSTAMEVMRAGVTGDPRPAQRRLRRPLRSLPESLAAMPAGAQERWFARLWLLRPLILATLSAFWIASGVIGFARAEPAAAAIARSGFPSPALMLVVGVTSAVDLALGLALLVRPLARWALRGMVLVSLAYLVGGSILAPFLWIDPLGPLVKVFPALVLALVALAVLDAR